MTLEEGDKKVRVGGKQIFEDVTFLALKMEEQLQVKEHRWVWKVKTAWK